MLLPAYAELHCLSNFSFLRGASHPEELVERAHALGYAALAITDECSVAGVVRAHLAAKEAGLPLVIGSEFTLADGMKLVLLATDRASYGDLSQLITRGRRNAAKGTLCARRATTSPSSRRAASRCGCRRRSTRRSTPALCRRAAERRRSAAGRRRFPGRAWIAVELFARAGDRARLARIARLLARGGGLPLVAAGDVHMHVRARRALQDTLTAIRLSTPLAECGHALLSERRAAPALARAARDALSARAAGRDARDRAALHVSRSTSCATSIRRRSCRRARRRRRTCAQLDATAGARRGAIGIAPACPPTCAS